jgi:hypothetical protein
MTEPDILNLKISDLKEWQREAWRRIADPVITPFERREIQNHIKESDGELRHCLQMMSERVRFHARAVEDVATALQNSSSDFLVRDCAEMPVGLGGHQHWL